VNPRSSRSGSFIEREWKGAVIGSRGCNERDPRPALSTAGSGKVKERLGDEGDLVTLIARDRALVK